MTRLGLIASCVQAAPVRRSVLPNVSLQRGALFACLVLGGLSAAACAAPAQERACTVGQAELAPLQPLAIDTKKGRFKFDVEVADREDERETGLMCRTALGRDRGMLFDFEGPKSGVAFWMHNTLIPLDIIFIRQDGRVLSVARNAKPLDDTQLPAGGTIRGVLELAGGRAAEIGLMPGDQVIHGIFAP